jgi:hypothetical protein
MKKLLLLLLIMPVVMMAQQMKDASVTDFRDIPWGAKLDSAYKKDSKVEFLKDNTLSLKNAYTVRGDEMAIGNVRLNRLNYVFNDDNRFFKVAAEGPKTDFEQMKFILTYKFGQPVNERVVGVTTVYQWLVRDVTFTLKQNQFLTFELSIESSWQDAEAYKKNISVNDF